VDVLRLMNSAVTDSINHLKAFSKLYILILVPESVTIIKIKLLILFREKMDVYCENYIERINTLLAKCIVSKVKSGDLCKYH